MRVFVTGSTGLVGAHTALLLLEKGHKVTLLVRNQDLAENYFSQRGYTDNEYIIGDMCDKATIKAAMQGCDAVIHSAAFVSLDPRKADEVYNSNINSIDAVLGSACELGIKSIVYVSSIGALFRPGLKVLDEQTPLGTATDAYQRSKRDCEALVRDMQAKGMPIQITYPAGVYGPDDPKLNESNESILAFLDTMVPITSSGIQTVDVRDLAAMQVYLLENPKAESFEQARYMIAGHYRTWSEFHKLLETVVGRKVFKLRIPGALLRGMGRLMDLVQRIYPVDTSISHNAMMIITHWAKANSDKIVEETGLTFRSGEETLTDTIKWLVTKGHLPAKQAGKLGNP